MTKTKAREWLRAVRTLIQHYKDGDVFFDRPLCDIGHCRDCLWKVFAKIYCVDYKDKYFPGFGGMRDVREDPRWVKLSIARLRRWEKRLLAIIEGESP